MKQRELADRLGTSDFHISRLENGHSPVGRDTARGLALLKIVARLDGNDKPLAVEIAAMAEEGLKA